jgi:hypothetical protein
MWLRSFTISLLAVTFALSIRPAPAGGCLKDTRQIEVDQTNIVRLVDYLCTTNEASLAHQ